MKLKKIAIDKTKRKQVIDFLKDSRLFAHFPVEILEKLVPLSTITEYSKGTEILYEGQIDNTRIFFLIEGSVNIHAGGELILKLQRKGDIFGEMGVITEKPSSASVVADTDLKVLTMNAKDIGSYKDSDSTIYQHVIYRVFSMILADKLILTTQKAQQFVTTNRILTDQTHTLVTAKLELDSQFMTSLHMEEKLAESEDRYRKLFNNAQVGLFRTNIESGEILECNQYIVEMFGYDTPEEVKKAIKSSEIYANKVDRENMIIELAKDGKIVQKSILFKKKDGTTYWGSYSINIFNEQGFMEGVLVDITEQKMAEAELKKHQDQLEELIKERTAQLEEEQRFRMDFFSHKSHDIRNKFSGILAFSKFGVDKIDKVDKAKLLSYFQRINKTGEDLYQVLNTLLDLSKLEAGHMEFVFTHNDLILDIQSSIESLRGRIEEKELNVIINSDPNKQLIVEYDRTQLDSIVSNLLSNAIKFSPEGKTIKIYIYETILDNVSAIRISVIDQGPGIPDEDMNTIFEPYKQSEEGKKKEASTGLGLSICRLLVDGHNGKIWAENNPEGGATFSFMLPYEQEIG